MESSLRWRVHDSNISINAHALTKLVPLGGVGLKCLISKCLEPTLDPFFLSLFICSSPFLSCWKAYGVFFEVEGSWFQYFHQCTRFNKVGSLRWCRLEVLISKCLEPTLDPFVLSLLIRSSPFLSRWKAYGVFFEVEGSWLQYFHQCTRFNKVGSLRWCRLEVLISKCLEPTLDPFLLSLLIRSSPFLSRWKAYGVFFEVEGSRFQYFHQCTRFNKVGSLRWCRLEVLISKCLEPTLDPFLLSLLIRSSPFLSRWKAYGVFFEVEGSWFQYFHQCTRFNKVGSLRWCRLEVLISKCLEPTLDPFLLSLLIRSSPFLSRWKAYGVFFEVEGSWFTIFPSMHTL